MKGRFSFCKVLKNLSKFLFISGGKDSVVKHSDMSAVFHKAKPLKANFKYSKDFSHPFQDPPDIHLQRMNLIKDFILNTTE